MTGLDGFKVSPKREFSGVRDVTTLSLTCSVCDTEVYETITGTGSLDDLVTAAEVHARETGHGR